MTKTPYSSAPPSSFWRRSVSNVPFFDVDPVMTAPFNISTADRVATAGSCFAQHIARILQEVGLSYHVFEPGPIELPAAERLNRNYGVFSGRYGNIYTTRQLLQLWQRAFDGDAATAHVWVRSDGRFVDGFRPGVEPNGFDSVDAVLEDRSKHLACFRQGMEDIDVFVFTLGLTESWHSSIDGFTFPVAPGVLGGTYDSNEHSFKNLSVAEVEGDLVAFIRRLRAINTNCRILLTVSPVPLVATARDVHVLSATTYSKSVLRVAAESVVMRFDNAAYFPSYEIITGSYNRGRYYETDAREVNHCGVSHVMKLFLGHYVGGEFAEALSNSSGAIPSLQLQKTYARASRLVCEEEAIGAAQ
jgi:hypothetical protein